MCKLQRKKPASNPFTLENARAAACMQVSSGSSGIRYYYFHRRPSSPIIECPPPLHCTNHHQLHHSFAIHRLPFLFTITVLEHPHSASSSTSSTNHQLHTHSPRIFASSHPETGQPRPRPAFPVTSARSWAALCSSSEPARFTFFHLSIAFRMRRVFLTS